MEDVGSRKIDLCLNLVDIEGETLDVLKILKRGKCVASYRDFREFVPECPSSSPYKKRF
jgi:hypothetical protein